MLNVVFICTGNICRSPMAEYYLKSVIKTKNLNYITCFSAGVQASVGFPAAEHAHEVMQELGIDMSAHEGRQLTSYMVDLADWLFVMEMRQKNALGKNRKNVLLLSEFSDYDIGYDIVDPYGSSLEAYRAARDRIIDCIDGFVRRLTSQQGQESTDLFDFHTR